MLDPEKFKQARIKAGFTQYALSVAVGVSVSCVCHWEKGKRSPDDERLTKIASILNIEKNEISKGEANHGRSNYQTIKA